MSVNAASNHDAVAAFKAGDFGTAVAGFSDALVSLKEAEPRAVALNNRAAALLELGRLEEAEMDARECVELRPAWPKSHIRLIKVLQKKGEHDHACHACVLAMRQSKELHAALLPTLRAMSPTCAEVAKELDFCRSPGVWDSVLTWEGFWQNAQRSDAISDARMWRACEEMSWALTLAAALDKFDLSQERGVSVHIVGAVDRWDKVALSSGFMNFLPFHDMHMTLIGPELTPSEHLEIVTHNNSKLSIDVHPGLWHDFIDKPMCEVPDLVIAYHPGLAESSIPWKKTFRQVVLLKVPAVFTAWSEEEQQLTREFLGSEPVQATVEFDSAAPFASPLKDVVGSKLTMVRRNSFWLGVRGGDAPSDDAIKQEMQNCMARTAGISEEELARIQSNPEDPASQATVDKIKSSVKESQQMIEIKYAIDEYNQAHDLVLAGALEKAEKSLKHSIRLASRMPTTGQTCELLALAHAELGGICRAREQWREAIEEYTKSLKYDAERSDTHHDLGVTLQCSGNNVEAIKSFRRATDLSPEDAEAFSGLGSSLVHTGNVTEALNAFHKAALLAPTKRRYTEQVLACANMLRPRFGPESPDNP